MTWTSAPGEIDDTTRKFAAFLRSFRDILGNGSHLFVHYNPAFAKAQTPYQYLGNTRPFEARRKFVLLQSELKGYGIEFISIIPDAMTYYQPVLALGDFNSGRVLAYLYRKAYLSEDDWMRSFSELGFDDSRYFATKDPNEILPWEHIRYTEHGSLKRRAGTLIRSFDIPVLGNAD